MRGRARRPRRRLNERVACTARSRATRLADTLLHSLASRHVCYPPPPDASRRIRIAPHFSPSPRWRPVVFVATAAALAFSDDSCDNTKPCRPPTALRARRLPRTRTATILKSDARQSGTGRRTASSSLERLSAAGAFAVVERSDHRDADAVGDVGLLGRAAGQPRAGHQSVLSAGLRIRSGARPGVRVRSATSRSRSILDFGSSRTRCHR